MKKIVMIVLCLCLSFPLFSCEQVTKNPEGDIAYISYNANSADENYHQAIVNALKEYTDNTDVAYAEYQLRETTVKAFTKTLDLAIKTGATTFIIPYDFYQSLMEVHQQYADAKFLALDTIVDEAALGEVKNVYSVNFNSYEMGYLTGYMVGLEDYTSIGYASAFTNMVQEHYISGIAQGLNDAAKTMDKKMTFNIYNYQDQKLESIEAGIALAYQQEIDVFFYLGSTLYNVLDEYTERSGFKFVSYCANEHDPAGDLMQVAIDYKELFLKAIHDIRMNSQEINLIYGFTDHVQMLQYDMNYLKPSTERAYMKFRDGLLDGSLVLEGSEDRAWRNMKLSNVTIIEK